MEEHIIFLKEKELFRQMEDNLNFPGKWKMTSIFVGKWKTTLIFKEMEDNLNYLGIWKKI